MRYPVAFLCLLLLASCQTTKDTTRQVEVDAVAFVGVHVLPMTENTVLEDQTVLITNGKISRIAPVGEVQLEPHVRRIEGGGRYLMPGIAEMHAHIPVPQDGDDAQVRETLFLYLSNGITLIRGMLGNPYHLELKELIAADSILSPRVYTSSPSMNGGTVQSKEEAEQKVRQYAADGYDFLKIHPGIQLDVFETLSATAQEVGIPFSGHVPTAVGVERAIDFRYASIDHLDGYIDGLVPKSPDFDPDAGGLFGYNFAEQCDPDMIPTLVHQTKEAGVWVVPTQSLLVRWLSPQSGAQLMAQPEMQYIAPGTRYSWRQTKDQFIGAEEYSAATARVFISLREQLLKEMERQGVDLLLGSDAPQVLNVPGFSIQHEMQSMAEAGLSNFTILQSGTANPARFFGAEGQFGTVTEGASADLILLSGNPLDDLQHMQRPEGVMVRGQWLDRAMIDAKLAAIAERHAGE